MGLCVRAHRLELAGVAAMTAVVIAGCGSGSSSPTDAVKQFISAIRGGDGKKACSLLTPTAQGQVISGRFSCEQAVKQIGPLLKPQLADVKVGNADVHGTDATVPVNTPQKHAVYTLQKTGDRWVISSLAGR
ncbi:MAG: DUF4878 domain-containing protein [Actinobacteria bacterium]|nr:MAG: DUF4878 domain-containing protein [Actinomycetota bacterium]